MNWKTIKETMLYIIMVVLAIVLIEYDGELLIDVAGDLFGALAISFVALALAEE